MLNGPRVLVVDDDVSVQRFLAAALQAAGYEHLRAATGAEGLSILAGRAPDVLVLDLGLPDMDGKSVLTRARAFYRAPILILSARDYETEKVQALDLGADDYVPKPFLVGELIARIGKALRRHIGRHGAASRMRFGAVELDLLAHVVVRDGSRVDLTRREYRLLETLAQANGRLVGHRTLLLELWGPAHLEDIQYLRIAVSRLRQKIEPDPGSPRIVLTEPGVGYRLADPDREANPAG